MSSLEEHRRSSEPVEEPSDGAAAPVEAELYIDAPWALDFRADMLSSDGVHRVILRGELDMVGAPVLWQRICEASEQPTRAIRLDLRKLTFMDSSGLHVVLNAYELCMRAGYEFALVGGTPAVRRLFEVSGLGGMLPAQRP
jgi:anti-sigma B factor antagonist